jgi:hypothetical protein
MIMDLSSYPAGWTGAAVLQGRVEKLFRRNVFCPPVGFDQAVEQNGAEWTVQGGGGGDVSPGTAELHDLAAQNQVGAGICTTKEKTQEVFIKMSTPTYDSRTMEAFKLNIMKDSSTSVLFYISVHWCRGCGFIW